MASVQRFSAKVIAVRQLTHDVRQIDFRLMEPRRSGSKRASSFRSRCPMPEQGGR